jgi:hypothetical protein
VIDFSETQLLLLLVCAHALYWKLRILAELRHKEVTAATDPWIDGIKVGLGESDRHRRSFRLA